MQKSTSQKGVKIRHNIQPGDIGYVIYLHGILYREEHNFDLSFEFMVVRTFNDFIQSFDGERDRLWVAELDGEIVGSVAIKGRQDNKAQLRWYLVHPRARGRGVGRQLMKLSIDFCKDCGYDMIFLHTVKQLEAAAHIYTSAGFTKTVEKKSNVWDQPVIENIYEMRL